MRVPTALALLGLGAGFSVAGYAASPPYGPQCTTAAPNCTQPIGNGPQCDRPCQPPCQPPCPPSGPPRRAIPREGFEQPRDAVGPTGNYVAPPASGTIEGPQRGYEVGTMAITFPELTISLPRIRFGGCSHFLRNSRMHLDSAVAPYVENPYAAYQAGLTQQPAVDRGAEEDERDAEPRKAVPREATGPECTDSADLHNRLDRLERSLEQQLDAMNRCMRDLKQIQQQSPHQAPQKSPYQSPYQAPQQSPIVEPLVPPQPSPAAYQVGPAAYLQPVPMAPTLRRLPPVSEEW
jgi:hypothetical protein